MLTLSRRLRTAGAAASGPGALVGAVLLLAACGGGQAAAGPSPPPSSQSGSATALPPPAAPEPSPATPVTAADIRAVGEKVFAGPHPSGCDWRDRATCPVTDRLAARLTEITQPPASGPGPLNPFCRCQNVPAPAAVVTGELTPTGGVAHVTLGAPQFDLIVVRQGTTLLVDDMRCGGRDAETSVFAPQLVLCST